MPRWFIVSLAVLGVLLCGTCVVTLTIGKVTFDTVSQIAGPPTPGPEGVRLAVDRFMKAMAANDPDAAHASLAPAGRTAMTKQYLIEQLGGPDWIKYEGYIDCSVDRFLENTTILGSGAIVTGKLRYENSTWGLFNATMDQENGEWALKTIEITTSTNKTPGPPPR